MSHEDRELGALVAEWSANDHVRQVATWNSRTARLTLWRAGDALLLVKQLETAELAARLHDVLREFAGVAPVGVRSLPPLGWAPEPPCVGMPYVEAPSLESLISGQWIRWNAPPVDEIVRRVGLALAAFHGLTRVEDPKHRAEADQALALVFEHVPPEVHDRLYATADRALPVRVYDDINPSHVLVEANAITLIDLPSAGKVTHPHRDLAWFTDKLFMSLLRSVPRLPAVEQLVHLAALRRRLLHAYFEAAGSCPTEGDDDLVAAFQSRYLSRRARSMKRSPISSSFFRLLLRLNSRRFRSGAAI